MTAMGIKQSFCLLSIYELFETTGCSSMILSQQNQS